jgi:hypothetical protein
MLTYCLDVGYVKLVLYLDAKNPYYYLDAGHVVTIPLIQDLLNYYLDARHVPLRLLVPLQGLLGKLTMLNIPTPEKVTFTFKAEYWNCAYWLKVL